MKRVVTYCCFIFIISTYLVDSCTVICIGKNATSNGNVIVAHTDDGGGDSSDIRLIKVPGKYHPYPSKRPVYQIMSGYPRLVTLDRGNDYLPKLNENISIPLGYIPQVNYTYGYFDHDYGLMNEKQLSIVESTCGAKTVGWSLRDNGYNLFSINELTKIALERCSTAICAIKTMGKLAETYGFYSEDSGDMNKPNYGDSAEALGISDRLGQVWIFHVLTGLQNKSAIWVAKRVPDNHVSALANGFMIREVNLTDTDNYLGSSSIYSSALEMKWWDGKSPFDFTAVYGYDDNSPELSLYIGRRLWRIYDLLAPSLNVDSTFGWSSLVEIYPFSTPVEKLVDLNDVIKILQDYYQNTTYDMSKGISAGPFGLPIRYSGPSNATEGNKGGWERPISMFRTLYSFISVIYPNNDIFGTFWFGEAFPTGTIYLPFSCIQESIPKSYGIGQQSKFNKESAWWAFTFVNNWSYLRYNVIYPEIQKKQAYYQLKAISMHNKIMSDIINVSNVSIAKQYFANKYNIFAENIISNWWDFAWELVGKYADGYIVTGELPGQMQSPGYPLWFLQLSGYIRWPGDTFRSVSFETVRSHSGLPNSPFLSNQLYNYFIIFASLILLFGTFIASRNKKSTKNHKYSRLP